MSHFFLCFLLFSFLGEMNGLQFLKNWKSNYGSSNNKKKSSNPHCYHEDGGPRAVLEPFDPNSPEVSCMSVYHYSMLVSVD